MVNNAIQNARTPPLLGRSLEGAINLESLIEWLWGACEGDGGSKRPQPLTGRVRRRVRYGNIAQVIDTGLHRCLRLGRNQTRRAKRL